MIIILVILVSEYHCHTTCYIIFMSCNSIVSLLDLQTPCPRYNHFYDDSGDFCFFEGFFLMAGGGFLNFGVRVGASSTSSPSCKNS